MSIQREYNKYILQCDASPEAEEFDSWAAASAHREATGWKAKKFEDEYFHFCPDCEVPM